MSGASEQTTSIQVAASAVPQRSSHTALNVRCTHCATEYLAIDLHFGCPACSVDVPANLEVLYADPPHDGLALREKWGARMPGLWRYADMLPVAVEDAVTLGEGGTPLIACPQVGASVGLPGLHVKYEPANPTWSFKDRMAAVAVAWAKAAGLPGVSASSSGNAGAAVAAYAARAGLPCVIFTTRTFPGTMQRFMRSYGAMVVATPTGPDRWTLNRAVAREWGWLPISNVTDPPVGSHPVGIEGYKTIAYEIAQDFGWEAPDAIIVPVGYGDAIAGIWRGFQDLLALGLIDHAPRMIAAESYGSLRRALDSGQEVPAETGGSGSIAYSVAVPRGTYQALRAIRASGGTAVPLDDVRVRAARQELATQEGLLVELSSALPLAAARALVATGELRHDDRVVLLITSSGIKDLEVESPATELPLVEPDLTHLRVVLREQFGYDAP